MENIPDFDEWYRRQYAHVLAAVAVAVGCHPRSVEDATADAFVKAYERWDKISVGASPTGWTTRVAINRARRRAWRYRRESELPIPVERASGDAGAESNMEFEEILSVLPARQRRALLLRYMADLSQQEIAAELDVAPGTAAATLHQARRSVKQNLATDTFTGVTDG